MTPSFRLRPWVARLLRLLRDSFAASSSRTTASWSKAESLEHRLLEQEWRASTNYVFGTRVRVMLSRVSARPSPRRLVPRQVCRSSLKLILQLLPKVPQKRLVAAGRPGFGGGLARRERLVGVAAVAPLVDRAVDAPDGAVEAGLPEDL